ncbi:hypothetical protein POV16_13675, partial [Enterobacter kobei]
ENVGAILGEEIAELARIALASLEAEVVGYVDAEYAELLKSGHIESCSVYAEQGEGCITLFTVPPAPVSVPGDVTAEDCPAFIKYDLTEVDEAWARGFNACRAAMLQGGDTELHSKAAIHDALCAKYNVESLADFVEWKRNHIAELEAAPPAPVGPDETAVMPDYPGYVMTQRECFEAGKKARLAELVTTAYKLPEGWVAVPVEPTAEMISSGIAAHYERSQIQIHDRPAPGPMECAYVAMLAAAPQQEVK